MPAMENKQKCKEISQIEEVQLINLKTLVIEARDN